MRAFFSALWHVGKIAVAGPGWGKGAGLFGTVLGLNLVGVWVGVQLIAWNKAFYDALENLDAALALRQVGVFFGLTAASAACALASQWLQSTLSMHWRARLTDQALTAWGGGKAYWRLRAGFTPQPIDNPDQRVAEDCRQFVSKLLLLTLGLISSVVALFSYVSVLWALSGFPLAFWGIEIPHYMVWAAFLYVAIASGMTHLLGRRLRGLFFTQERREADFRHALMQMRERAEQVARSHGEAAERRRLDRYFDAIRGNWRQLIGQELLLGMFTRPYQQTIFRIPTFLALPAYFASFVTLGGLMQLASAFSNVTTTLSWFVFRYKDLAEMAATSDRLSGLFHATAAPPSMPHAVAELTRTPSAEGVLRWQDLRLATPEGVALAPLRDGCIARGARVWVSGPSGVGKSTFLAAVLGLWSWGHGRLQVPQGRWLILPHGGALFPDGLAASLTYPHDPKDFAPEALARVLGQVGLVNRLHLLEAGGDLALAGLSQGECQRIGLARALLLQPDFLILDEATSALDTPSERLLFATLLEALPQTTMLCVSHRNPVGLNITQHLLFSASPHGKPRLVEAKAG